MDSVFEIVELKADNMARSITLDLAREGEGFVFILSGMLDPLGKRCRSAFLSMDREIVAIVLELDIKMHGLTFIANRVG